MKKDSHSEQNYSTLIVRMARSFSEFDDNKKENFLTGFSRITGSSKEDIKSIEVQEGCVHVILEVFPTVIQKLRALYTLYKRNRSQEPNNNHISESQEFNRWFDENHVCQIVNDCDYISKLPPLEKDRKAIIFVHGWNGNKSSFGELPKYLANRYNCETDVYPYGTGIAKKCDSLFFVSENLDLWIRNHYNYGKLALITHSMGGIVARKMITTQMIYDDPLDVRVKQLTLVASPHKGAVFAEIAEITPFVNSKQLSEITPGSPFLAELNKSWGYWAGRNVPNSCRVRNIYGTHDAIVSRNNACGDDINAAPILGAGHIDIVKPPTDRAEIVLTLNRFLEEAAF